MKPAIRPEPIEGEPQAVRWVIETDLPMGEVVRAPGTLGPLMEYGVLTRMTVESGGLCTWLADSQRWTDHGTRIRDAVIAAVRLQGWQIAQSSQ